MSDKIIDALVVAAEMTGATLSKPAIRGMVMELATYPEDRVLKALARCCRELKFRITLADIIERLSGADGRPNADEAWGRALQAFDEAATVVLNDEIAQAMNLARPMYEERDKVGARMAFRSAYDRLVQDAKDAGKPVNWYASLGHDKHGREGPIKEAIHQGLLLASQEAMLLPPPSIPKALNGVAGLLEYGAEGSSPPGDEMRRKLLALRDDLAGRKVTSKSTTQTR